MDLAPDGALVVMVGASPWVQQCQLTSASTSTARTPGTAFERWTAGGSSMTATETDDVGRHLSELLAAFLAHPQIDVPDLTYDPRGEPWH